MAELITKKIAGNLDNDLKFKSTRKLDIFEDYTTTLKSPPSYTNTPSWAYDYENRNYIANKSIIGLIKSTNKAIWNGDIKFIKQHGLGIKNQITFSDFYAIHKTIKGIGSIFSSN